MLASQRETETQLRYASIEGNIDTVKQILDKNPEIINEQSDTGYSALILASKHGHLDIVKFLLSKNAKTDLCCGGVRDRHSPALMLAAEQGYVEIVRELLDAGAPVDQQNQYGSTALMWASYLGFKEIVQLLLDRGANLRHSKEDGTTAIANAYSAGHHDIAEMIQTESNNRILKAEQSNRMRLFLLNPPTKNNNAETTESKNTLSLNK